MAFKHEPQNHIGKTNTWLTPPHIIHNLGPFDLDPCAEYGYTTARNHYYDNGLQKEWHGFIWLNPPYGKYVGEWMFKLSKHGNGIALVFARTDTKWFKEASSNCSLFLFVSGRISFLRPDKKLTKSNAGAPSVFMAYGDIGRNKLINSKFSGIYLDRL